MSDIGPSCFRNEWVHLKWVWAGTWHCVGNKRRKYSFDTDVDQPDVFAGLVQCNYNDTSGLFRSKQAVCLCDKNRMQRTCSFSGSLTTYGPARGFDAVIGV